MRILTRLIKYWNLKLESVKWIILARTPRFNILTLALDFTYVARGGRFFLPLRWSYNIIMSEKHTSDIDLYTNTWVSSFSEYKQRTFYILEECSLLAS